MLAALHQVQPDVVLVELPSDTEAVLALAADHDMQPPVALLTYVVDRPERAAFYPFAAFSPEWCALRWALERGVPVRAIDLPAAVTMAPGPAAAPGLAPAGPTDVPGLAVRATPVDPLGELAGAAGYDDAERWWEDVIEHRGPAGDALATFAAVADAIGAVRAGVPLVDAREAQREATMRIAIRAALKAGHERIVVVCGAWHVPALVGPLPPAKDDLAIVRGLPRVKIAVTWTPWTHRRLASALGYGAGVRSPGWYAHVFTNPGPDGVIRWFADAARLLRAHDHLVSPDHLIAASRLASATAALRDRPVPGLDEVLDAALAVLADGRPGPLALIRDDLVVGDELGSVPESTPMVPLARDLAAQQKRLRLKPEARERVVELDLRQPQGRARSHLLHRLLALDLGWGTPDDGRGSSGTFRETWRLRWDPELVVRLVEAGAYGTTVAAAATARLRERTAATTVLVDLTAIIERALLADLPDAVGPAMRQVAERAALDPDVAHLMDAIGPLARAVRYGDVRATDVTALRAVVDGLVVRIVAGLGPACASLDDDEAHAMAERLTGVQAALALVEHPARRVMWPEVLARLAERDTGPALVSGRATRLVHDAGSYDAAAVGRRLSRALSVGTAPIDGAAFVEGFLAGSGTVLLHDASLLALLDSWLVSLPPDSFIDTVPLLRRTFGAFDLAERRQLGQLVAGRGDGRPVAPYGWDLDDARAARALVTVGQLLGARS